MANDFDLDEMLLENAHDQHDHQHTHEAEPFDGSEAEFGDLEAYDPLEMEDEFAFEDPLDGISAREVDDLAHELTDMTSEAEMEEFLGKLFRNVGRTLKRTARKVVPNAVRFLKGPATQLLAKALPIVGSAVGSAVPGLGTVIGGAAGGLAGNLLSSGAAADVLGSLANEMGHTHLEEARIDLARRMVRTVADAAANAAVDPAAASQPADVARRVLSTAMSKNLPHAARVALSKSGAAGARSGRWERRGNAIVLFNV